MKIFVYYVFLFQLPEQYQLLNQMPQKKKHKHKKHKKEVKEGVPMDTTGIYSAPSLEMLYSHQILKGEFKAPAIYMFSA